MFGLPTGEEYAALRRLMRPDLFRFSLSEEQTEDFVQRGYIKRTPEVPVITELGMKVARRTVRVRH